VLFWPTGCRLWKKYGFNNTRKDEVIWWLFLVVNNALRSLQRVKTVCWTMASCQKPVPIISEVSHSTKHTHTTVLQPFFRDHPGEPVPEENFWTLRCKGRLTEADTTTIRLGATPSGLTTFSKTGGKTCEQVHNQGSPKKLSFKQHACMQYPCASNWFTSACVKRQQPVKKHKGIRKINHWWLFKLAQYLLQPQQHQLLIFRCLVEHSNVLGL